MCDREYVTQTEDQNAGDGKHFAAAMDADLRASCSRRTSSSSQNSVPLCTSPNYDSGNFSCSNTSDISNHRIGDISSVEDDGSDYLPDFNLSELTDDVKQLQKDLREKDQMLLLTVEENRRIKSELERLNKSERWYKNELKSQKRSRLDILEKFYLNERQFVKENQKLKSECSNLATICSELENKGITERNSLLKQLQEVNRLFDSTKVGDGNLAARKLIDELKFDLQKQRENVQEKETLIDVLKKQKQSLLRDLDNNSSERDSKILSLEANAFTLEQENRKITKNCVTLVKEKQSLEEDLRKQEKILDDTKSLLLERELTIEKINDRQKKQIMELEAHREEINRLRILTKSLQEQIEHKPNEKMQLFEKHAKDLEKKSEEISKLQSQRVSDNTTISKLQEKLVEYKKLKENFDRYVELLQTKNETLEVKKVEIEYLKTENHDLQTHVTELENIIKERVVFLEGVKIILSMNQHQIVELENTVQNYSSRIENLSGQVAESMENRIKLDECRKLLVSTKDKFILQENEMSSLRNLVDTQSQKLTEFDQLAQENPKLHKEIDNLRLELSKRQDDYKNLQKITTEKDEGINILSSKAAEIKHLQEMIEEKSAELRRRDFEIETLRLVVRGQKAQIKRFNCKCAENEEIRQKFEEASNLLRVDKEVFENEAHELEHLRGVAETQAEKIYKLLEEAEPLTFHSEQYSEPYEDANKHELRFQSFDSHELEAKALKIERMQSLLEKKSDRITQLNCETDQWIELLTNLRISKFRSRTSSPQKSVVGYRAQTKSIQNADNGEKSELSSEFISLSNICNYQESIVIIHPPQENLLEDDAHSEVVSHRISTRSSEVDYSNDEDPDWRILTKVIQSEHKKKISRYEIHMRTLLDHIKDYKKKVKTIERKYQKLVGRFRELEDHLKDSEREKEMMKTSYETEMNHLMTAKIKEIQEWISKSSEADRRSSESEEKILEVSRKYKKSQKIIDVLKRQLETARTQFLEMDDYKRISVELKLNLNNFMDDYKKLLNPKDSYKSSIAADEIYDLIKRSNSFVPNFDNLANSIDALKVDLKKFSPVAAVGFSPLRKFSLMDELRAADAYQFS